MLGMGFALVSSRLDEHHTTAGRGQQLLYAHLRRMHSEPPQKRERSISYSTKQ
jgi:hypothetical protein